MTFLGMGGKPDTTKNKTILQERKKIIKKNI